MKGMIIYAGKQPDEAIDILDFGEPLHKTVGAAVEGHIEIVRPVNLPYPLLMIVNEEGLIRGLDLNPIASILYGIEDHGQSIVGNAVIMKEGYVDGEPDVVGLDPEDVRALALIFDRIFYLSDGLYFLADQEDDQPLEVTLPMLLKETYKMICHLSNNRESLIQKHSLGLLDHNDFVDMYHARNQFIDLLISEYHMLGGKRRVDHYHREDIA